jgi:hypothetical protein
MGRPCGDELRLATAVDGARQFGNRLGRLHHSTLSGSLICFCEFICPVWGIAYCPLLRSEELSLRETGEGYRENRHLFFFTTITLAQTRVRYVVDAKPNSCTIVEPIIQLSTRAKFWWSS